HIEQQDVYVPALLGTDGTLEWRRRREKDVLARQFWTDLRTLLPLLDTKPHLLVLSRVQTDFQHCRTSNTRPWGSALLCRAKHPNLWHATIERFPSTVPNNSLVFPYPARTHFRTATHPRPVNTTAKSTLVFGTWRTRFRHRNELKSQCLARPGQCEFYEAPRDNGAFDNALARTRTDAATFCLQPQGDTPSRSHTWDALLAICIPVLFANAFVLPMPFEKRLPWDDMVLRVPREAWGRGKNVVDYLAGVAPDRVALMQRTIDAHRHVFQYAVETAWPEEAGWTMDEAVAVAPEDDALTAGLKGFMVAALEGSR
ncbi:exostosin family-domain-containing protein, partial [Blyttiomyces helicus]